MLQSSNIERAKKACQVVGVKSFQLDLDPNLYRTYGHFACIHTVS